MSFEHPNRNNESMRDVELDIMSYSRFVNACKKANIQVNRKMLADLAVNDKDAFAVVVEAAKAAL